LDDSYSEEITQEEAQIYACLPACPRSLQPDDPSRERIFMLTVPLDYAIKSPRERVSGPYFEVSCDQGGWTGRPILGATSSKASNSLGKRVVYKL